MGKPAAVAAAAVLAACTGPGAMAGPTLDEIEAANEKLVRDFLAYPVDLQNPDPAYLYDYLAENFLYQYGQTRIEGLETYIAQAGPMLSSVLSYSIDIRRMQAMGNIVVNERIDIGTTRDGELRWHVIGVMVIVDGKIAEWRDYPMPALDPAP